MLHEFYKKEARKKKFIMIICMFSFCTLGFMTCLKV